MIRFALRWLIRLSVLALAAGIALVLLRDQLLREWLAYRLRAVTGLPAELAEVRTDLRAGSLTLRGLRVINSPEFGNSILLSVPDLGLQIDPQALLRCEFRLPTARLHLAEFNLVRNERGQTNIAVLLENLQQRASAADAITVAPPGFEFAGIDALDLTVGVVRFVQLGPEAGTREFQVGLNHETVRNVRTTDDLMPLVLRVLIREASRGLRLGAPAPAPAPAPAQAPNPPPPRHTPAPPGPR